ncbi:DUF6538 domain-containing protein [Allosphingosinicella humi]
MAGTSNLIQRKGRWYFNKAFPKELWDHLGRAPYRKSLKTSVRSEALRAKPEVERSYWAIVDGARLKAASAHVDKIPLTIAAAESLVAEWFRDWCSTIEDLRPTPRDPDDLAQLLDDADEEIARAKERLSMKDYSETLERARFLTGKFGYRWEEGIAGSGLRRLLARGDVAVNEIYRGRLLGDYGVRPSDPFFAALMDAPKNEGPARADPAPKRTIADLEVAYRLDRVAAAAPSTQASYTPVFRVLREVLGESALVANITRADGRRLFDAIKALPAGLGKQKALKGLSVPEAIAVGKRMGLPALSPKSINDSYMGFVSSIFSWAKREEWIAANPVEGLRVADTAPAKKRRDPFSLPQLQTLFASPPWSPPDFEGGGSEAIRYWGPLLALYQGMRRGEIAQLRPEDVEMREGFPVLHVRGDRLKTPNALRTLPVHPELVRLGFVKYARKQAKAKSVMLFSGEKANGRGQWGDPLGDWFNRRLKELKITEGKRLGMHSFRHNFEDRLREAGLHGTAIGAELAGRTKGGDVAAAYGSGFSTRTLAEAIAKVVYPGLNVASGAD